LPPTSPIRVLSAFAISHASRSGASSPVSRIKKAPNSPVREKDERVRGRGRPHFAGVLLASLTNFKPGKPAEGGNAYEADGFWFSNS
jgi:hypothetical protein